MIGQIAQPDLAQRIAGAKDVLLEAKAERDRQLEAKTTAMNANLESIHEKIREQERQIQVNRDQAALAAEQVKAIEQLLAKGLVTRDQALAARQKVMISAQSRIDGPGG